MEIKRIVGTPKPAWFVGGHVNPMIVRRVRAGTKKKPVTWRRMQTPPKRERVGRRERKRATDYLAPVTAFFTAFAFLLTVVST